MIDLSLDPSFACFLTDKLIDFAPDFDDFANSVNFTHSSTGRSIGYYGDKSYSYGSFHHPPVPFSDNCYVAELKELIESTLPSITTNSALINFYPTPQARLNLHCDDEPEIQSDSYIVTVSFGATRKLLFATNERIPKPIFEVSLANRSVLIFSTNSQRKFKHGIQADCNTRDYIISNPETRRISVTFRMLK